MRRKYTGLTSGEVEISRKNYGENKLKGEKKKGFFKTLLGNLNDPIIRVLIIALFINIIFSLPHINIVESIGIAVSVLIATLVSTISEYSSENAFEKLKKENENVKVTVKRNGDVYEIDQNDVVVGDLLVLEAGAMIPADCYLISGTLSLDESSLTGESQAIIKSPLNNEEALRLTGEIYEILEKGKELPKGKKESTLLKGSLITHGYGEAIAIRVGEKTYIGAEAKKLSSEQRPSPLKKRLTHLAKIISIIGYVLAVIVALLYLFNAFFISASFEKTEILSRLTDVRFVMSKILSAITLGVSITVVAVPEGLPMMITVVLSSNMKKMANDNVLVRKLVGIETSGNISMLFTDKTGTLTEGNMKLVGYATSNAEYKRKSINTAPKIEKYITLCANYCTNAIKQDGKIISKDATERALLSVHSNNNLKAKIVEKIPFDSDKKYSAVRIRNESEELVIFKGAPEVLLSASTHYLDENGIEIELTPRKINEIKKKQDDFSSQGLRVIAIGIKTRNIDTSLDEITFVSLVSFKDTIRKEVHKAIKEVKEAGVNVVMITGDSKLTATAIAKECGIITPYSKQNVVLEASELHKMTDQEVKDILPNLAVVSRALPSDKSRLVTLSSELGYVVGMTGDGINDASSLKLADVGFAMGSGTEVAKEASDIVIKDNNFASIVKAILYGRTIFSSIRKFIVFQLIMNFSAVGISIIGPFIGVPTPVTITQMLWVNIIMDTLGALAFASEPPLKTYMKREPISSNEKILTKKMIQQIVAISGYILCLSTWFLTSERAGVLLTNGTEKYLLSSFFAMFIFTGVFVCFTVRTPSVNLLKNLSKNPPFAIIMTLILIIQIFFVYFGGEVLRTVPLAFCDVLSVTLISLSVVAFDTLRKLGARLKRKSIHKKKYYNLKGKI